MERGEENHKMESSIGSEQKESEVKCVILIKSTEHQKVTSGAVGLYQALHEISAFILTFNIDV